LNARLAARLPSSRISGPDGRPECM
jgi:hypothetical protein